MRLVLAAGSTATAEIDGISAAGASSTALAHTPSADAEIVAYGETVRTPVVPVSPTGCPTPAVVTRAVRERLGFDATVVDAGLARPTGAPTVDVGAEPGDDVREPEAVPDAGDVWEAARRRSAGLPDDDLLVAETIPGGTTTALGVLRALGEDVGVSSSFSENPVARKERVVADALAASDLAPGDLAGEPVAAVGQVGDPVLAVVAGVTVGAVEAGADVTLAGGSQMLAAAALVRHASVEARLAQATTSYVADDDAVALRDAADRFDLDLTVTDPGFDAAESAALRRYAAGEAKEGVGMGGALALADDADIAPATVRADAVAVHDRLGGDGDGA